jgi:pimeloyl-ACP methyl ester carboxylesterase
VAEVHAIEIPTRGFVFDALEAGPRTGDPVVFLHGFPQTSHCWHRILPIVADAGYHVLAPDQRGYSPRARPQPVDAYRRDELVEDVLAFADFMGADRVHVVGHDWGALVAWQLAGRRSERIRSVTALSVPHPRAMFQAVQPGSVSDQRQRSSYVELFRAEGSELGMLANEATGLRLVYVGAGLSEAEAAPYLEAVGNVETLRAALNWYRAARLIDIEGLGPVTVPVLFVWSTNDPAISREAAMGCGEYVDGPFRSEVLEGVSHWIPEQAADEVSRMLLEHLSSA